MENRTDDPILDKGIGSLPNRLQELIGEQSVRSFAQSVGISETAIRKYLKGAIPSLDKAMQIASACNIELNWLAYGDSLSTSHIQRASSKGVDSELADNVMVLTPEQHQAISEEFVLVPGYHIQVSAGHGSNALNEEPKRWLAFRRKYLKYKNLSPESAAVVFAKGDSMADTITDNDSLLIDLNSTKPIDGRIFVVRLGDELYAKRIQKSFDGSITLISDNKEYAPIPVPVDKLDQLCIVGQVVQRATDL